MPLNSIPVKTIARTSGIDSATTVPARAPRLKKLTASTMAIAAQSASRKPLTACLTTTG
jgi:hypothetical protein